MILTKPFGMYEGGPAHGETLTADRVDPAVGEVRLSGGRYVPTDRQDWPGQGGVAVWEWRPD